MKFAGDPKKAHTNLKNHGVSFQEAATVFRDPISVTGYDPDHSVDEDRFVIFGISKQRRLLVVSHTEEGEFVRIISSRLATKWERKIYEEG